MNFEVLMWPRQWKRSRANRVFSKKWGSLFKQYTWTLKDYPDDDDRENLPTQRHSTNPITPRHSSTPLTPGHHLTPEQSYLPSITPVGICMYVHVYCVNIGNNRHISSKFGWYITLLANHPQLDDLCGSQIIHFWKRNLPRVCVYVYIHVASFLGLPFFYLPFAFTIV